MKRGRVLATAALFGFSLVLGVSPSWAVTFPAIPANASDGLFSPLATSPPNPIFLTEPQGGETGGEGFDSALLLDVPGIGFGMLDLTDPGTGAVSDELSTHLGRLALASDPFGALASPTGLVPTLTETGGWQDIGGYFGLPPETLFAFSDTEVKVPEPTTLALLGSGLFGLAMMRRRKRPQRRPTCN
jgi:hypothetical protein